MTNATHPRADAVLRTVPTTADEWFARRHSRDHSDADDSVFKEWIAADARNAAEYAECEKMWNARHHLAANSDLVKIAFAEARLDRLEARPKAMKWAAGIGLAASIAAMAWITLGPERQHTEPGIVATARGEQQQIVLADGSKVQLNTDTRLVSRIDAAERRVILLHGEAFFDVVRDPERPFVVEVDASEIRVLGTQFNVREAKGKLEVTVREGTVNVVPKAKSVKDDERLELTRGHQLSYYPDLKLVKLATIDPDRALTWRSGMIEFDRATLADAVVELNRYAAKPLVIEDASLRSIELSGGFRVGDLNAVLFALSERFEIKSVDRDGRVVLTR